jgi:hypothetical protein
MRQRIKKQGAVLACSATAAKVRKNRSYCPQTLILWAIVVSGLSIYQGSRKECDDLCIQLRMKNQPADVVQVKTYGGLWR